MLRDVFFFFFLSFFFLFFSFFLFSVWEKRMEKMCWGMMSSIKIQL